MTGNLIRVLTLFANLVLIFLLFLVLYRVALSALISSPDKCDSRFCEAIVDKESPCYSETPGVPTCMAMPGYDYYPSLIIYVALLGMSLLISYLLIKKTSVKETIILFVIFSLTAIGSTLLGMKLF